VTCVPARPRRPRAAPNAAIERLKSHTVPGNLRELENLLRRAAALTPASVITAREISGELGQAERAATAKGELTDDFESAINRRLVSEFAAASPGLPAAGLYDRFLAEVERPLIAQALQATRGNQIRAAAILGINRNTLRKKIQTLGLAAGRND
jgi:two-component system nitrogen regulation response regulator GlnG